MNATAAAAAGGGRSADFIEGLVEDAVEKARFRTAGRVGAFRDFGSVVFAHTDARAALSAARAPRASGARGRVCVPARPRANAQTLSAVRARPQARAHKQPLSARVPARARAYQGARARRVRIWG